VARALDLEALRREAEGGDVDEVVAFVAREGDGVATVLVGARRARDVARERGDGDVGAFDGQTIWSNDSAADDVCLRVGGGGVSADCGDSGQQETGKRQEAT